MRVSVVALLALAVALSRSPVGKSHPQCLDSLPPFPRANRHCDDYNTTSCCLLHDEKRLKSETRILARRYGKSSRRAACHRLLLKVKCTQCSPWAQHIFEDTPRVNGTSFPNLCMGFCLEFYRTCFKIIFEYYRLSSIGYSNTVASATQFCQERHASTDYYCYPNIIDGPDFPDNEQPSQSQDNCLCGVTVASGLRNPIAAISAPGNGSARLFIAEQLGVIKVLSADNKVLPTPFLDIKWKVHTSAWPGDERGLLGLAFHPDYDCNGRFFVQYSAREDLYSHVNIVSEFQRSAQSPTIANLTSERVIFKIRQPEGNHNGGQLFFKDGLLFIVLGDGGGAGDRHGIIGNGLDTNTLHGSILRVDVSNTSVPYTIPPDNPFANSSGGRAEIYAYGLRNPWRCSVDRGDANGVGKGRIFCGDVGQSRFEEIDIIEKGGNYGWRAYEGFRCFDTKLCNSQHSNSSIPPIHAYPHAVGRSVTGGYVYRGQCFPRLRGKYLFADYGRGRLFALTENIEFGTWSSEDICIGDRDVCHNGATGNSFGHILSFAEDENGELFVLATTRVSTSSTKGSIIWLIDPKERSRNSKCQRFSRNLN